MKTIKLFLMAMVFTLSPAFLQAQESKREGLKELAAELGGRVKKSIGDRKVRIGYFTPTGIDHSNAGQGLAAELEIVLKECLTTESKGLEIKGDYYLVEDPNNKDLKVIKIEAVIKDLDRGGNFKEFTAFEGFVRHNADIAKIVGANVSFKKDSEYPGDPAKGKNKDIYNSLPPAPTKPPEKPIKHEGKQYKVNNYTIEIHGCKELNGKYEPLNISCGGKDFPGVPVVEGLEKGMFYRVFVKNGDGEEIAVFMAIDGIDQFAFTEDRLADGCPKFRSWIVPANKEVLIKGWHKNVSPGEVFGFLTTEAGKGAATKFPTLSQGKTGTITISIAHTKPEGTKGPGLETSVGPPIQVKQTAVTRVVGDPHEIITIRYSH